MPTGPFCLLQFLFAHARKTIMKNALIRNSVIMKIAIRFHAPQWGERPPPDERVDRPEVEAPRGAREPTGTNGPTLNNTHPPKRGACTGHARNHYTNHDQPTPPTRGARIEQQDLWWSQHRGNAQPPFRTWKLSPAAPMVLQPTGCGRVGHRHNTPKQADRDTPPPKGEAPRSAHTHPQTQHTRGPTSLTFRVARGML